MGKAICTISEIRRVAPVLSRIPIDMGLLILPKHLSISLKTDAAKRQALEGKSTIVVNSF